MKKNTKIDKACYQCTYYNSLIGSNNKIVVDNAINRCKQCDLSKNRPLANIKIKDKYDNKIKRKKK